MQSSVSKGWLNKNGGFEFTERYYLDPLFRRKQEDVIKSFIKAYFPVIPVYYMEDDLMQPQFMKDNQVLVGGIQPNMLLAAGMGAGFKFFPDMDSDLDGQPLNGLMDKDELPDFDTLINHPFFKEIIKQINYIKTDHPEYNVIPPFFWDTSGRATIHGIFTTSYKLIGEQALTMPYLNPELLHDVHHWIAETYIRFVRFFNQFADFKITAVHIGECSGTMLEPGLYETFIIPYLNKIGNDLAPVRLHSCGFSDHLLDKIALVKNLAGISTGSGTSVRLIRSLFGKDISVNYLMPVDLFQSSTRDAEIESWIENIIEENDCGNLSMSFHIEPDYDIKKCLSIHAILDKLNSE
ncbi:uroporphyrinogen decarboxylase family protein [Bacteroidota bacterium]